MFFVARLLLIVLGLLTTLVWWQKGQLAVWALTRTDPLPEVHALVANNQWAQADQFLDFFMGYDYVRDNPAAQQLQQEIQAKRSSSLYQLEKIGEGLMQGHSDETAGQIAAIASDLFVLGDLRDLAVQGWRWSQEEETDPVLIALASIGVAASAAQVGSAAAAVPTAGASTAVTASATTVKTAVTTLKSMRRLNQLPSWLSTALVSTARQMRRQRSLAGMHDAQALLSDVATLSHIPGGARLLGRTHDAASLALAARFARLHGKNTAALLRITGGSLNQTMHLSEQFGAPAVELAATYGRRGLEVLQRTGASAFLKYSARASKIAYKGDALRLLMDWLTRLPPAVLAFFTITGLLALWPRRSKRVSRSRAIR